MKLASRIIALVTCIFLLVPSLASASNVHSKASTRTKAYTQEELEARFNQIHAILQEVHEKLVTEDEAIKELAKINVVPEKGTNTAKKNGENIIALSNPEYAISLPTLFTFKDEQTGYWYAGAHFFWEDRAYWQADFPSPWPGAPNYGVAIGGSDGFGIVFSQPINRVTQSFDVYDYYGNRTSYSYPSKASQYGVGFTEQDYGIKSSDGSFNYDWDSGYMGIYFSPQYPGQQMSAWQEMAHTWASTSVYINGISYIGISWQFNTTSNEWTAVAPLAHVFTPD